MSQVLYVDIAPHGKDKVVAPTDLDKPNILERGVYDEAIISNASASQLYNKALFNVLRALKRGTKCTINLTNKNDGEKIGEEAKVAGFISYQIVGNKVILSKS